jgi:N-acetyltransferase 10
LSQAELLVIDEAAAIPLPFVKELISGSHMSFLSSTINGYEGTGRSLSLKLLQQLRQQNVGKNAADKTSDHPLRGRTLHELTLDESIRYKNGDQASSTNHHKVIIFIFRSRNGSTNCCVLMLQVFITSYLELPRQTVVSSIT